MFSSEDSTVLDTEEHQFQKTLADLFNVECDAALLMGMSYLDYWWGEPELFYVLAKKYKIDTENAIIERDTIAWLTGQYVLSALGVTLGNAFAKRGHPKLTYPEMPFYVQEHDEMAKAKKRERDLMRSYNNFIAAAQSMGKLSGGAAF